MSNPIQPAERISQIPPYLFAELDKKKAQLRERGMTLVDLSIGDPDIPTSAKIVTALREAAGKPENHRYPSYVGSRRFREAVARYYQRRHNVALDWQRETMTLIGSKEGIAHFPLAILNPGDIALVPDPGYPVYRVATLFAGGTPHSVPLLRENNFFPDWSKVPGDVLKKAKLIFLNYPNNPTSAVARRDQIEETLRFADKHNLVILYDVAYNEIFLDGNPAPSILEFPLGRERAIEMGSLSKTFNMTGWRVGYAVGNPQLVSLLGNIKTNVDTGVFTAIQDAAAVALDDDQTFVESRTTFKRRRDLVIGALERQGFDVYRSEATFYVWVATPKGLTSAQTANRIMEETGVVVTPGSGFGKHGEGYFRIAVTAPDNLIEEAIRRIQKMRW